MTDSKDKTAEERKLQQEEIADREKRPTIISHTIPDMDDPVVREGDPSGKEKGSKSTSDEDIT